jgi:hypothetical protein
VKNSRKKKLNTTDIRFYNDDTVWNSSIADYLAILLVRKEYKDLKIVYSIYVFLTTTHVILRNGFIIRRDWYAAAAAD